MLDAKNTLYYNAVIMMQKRSMIS